MPGFGIGKGARYLGDLISGTRGADKINKPIEADKVARSGVAQDVGVGRAFNGNTMLLKSGESDFAPVTEKQFAGIHKRLDDLGRMDEGKARPLTEEERNRVASSAADTKQEMDDALDSQKHSVMQHGLRPTRNKVKFGLAVGAAGGGGYLGWEALGPKDKEAPPPPTVPAKDVLHDPAGGGGVPPQPAQAGGPAGALPPELAQAGGPAGALPPELAQAGGPAGALPPELAQAGGLAGALPPELAQAGATAGALPPELAQAGGLAGALPPELAQAGATAGALPPELAQAGATAAALPPELAQAGATTGALPPELAQAGGPAAQAQPTALPPGLDPSRA